MKRFGIIFRHEYKQTVRSRPFIVISVTFAAILLCIAIAAAIAGFVLSGNISPDSTGDSAGNELIATDSVEELVDGVIVGTIYKDAVIIIDDRTGTGLADRLAARLTYLDIRQMSLDSDDAITAAIEGGDCDACIILTDPMNFDYYERSSMYGATYAADISYALEDFAKRDRLAALGISGSDADAVMYTSAGYTVRSIGDSNIGAFNIGKYAINYMMVILMFLVITLYGQMVATRIATEKGSRTMELLATSATPNELICGKVMGVGAASLTQLFVFLLLAFGMVGAAVKASPVLSGLFSSLLSFSLLDILWLCLYFFLGFLMIAFVYGGLGSMVSQVEDLSGLSSLPMSVFMLGYFVAIGTSVSGQSSPLLRIASLVPLWSPMTMFARMSVETVPVWEILLSLALLAGFAALAALAAAKLYRTGMLRYGKPPKLREIISVIKSK
ncbi:MAG: ABC transporter permease [Clostridia bacterium]|nr:ABC transporter permease [Clostridia bacterium]